MAARSVSPGGALLRTSRLFSLPLPIPPPPGDAVALHKSKTGTTVFPTHQIISTPSSSRARGDWGLKRPLPLRKTTHSTYAMLRVRELDSIESITDYSSATDLGITLRKFQELQLPVTVPKDGETAAMNIPQPSAFEEGRDVTAIAEEDRAALRDTRWKFNGPWLAGMKQGEFNKWLEKTVRPKRQEFREFLKTRLATEMDQVAAGKAFDDGAAAPAPIDPATIGEQQLTDYLRKLRNNRETLYDMVGHFLDLAPLQAPKLVERIQSLRSQELDEEMDMGKERENGKMPQNPYAEQGPPVTHPSAGLSYLRTSSYLDNHPFYGPQKSHPPVEARVVRPRRRQMGLDAKIGVAGFIADRPVGDTPSNQKNGGRIYDHVDVGTKGGSKVPVQPFSARIDSRGRVELTVGDVDREALLVALELLGEDETKTFRAPVKEDPQKFHPETRATDIRRRFDAPKMSNAKQYGLEVKATFPETPTFGQR